MKKLLWLIIIIAIVWGAYSLMGDKEATVSGEPIKIGFVGPLSGDAASYGADMKKIIDYRLAQINAAAGEEGQKFEIVYEDGKCTGADAANAFQKLTDIDGVKVVLGGACSGETLAISPLANEKKVVLLSALSSNPKIEDEGSYTFSLSYSDAMTGIELARAVSGHAKIAIITEQADFSIGLRDVFVESLKEYPSAKLVSNEVFPKGATDFKNILAKVQATKPDALVLNPVPGITAENLLKQLAAVKNWTGYKLYSQVTLLSDNSRAGVGSFAEGLTIVDVPAVTAPDFVALSQALEAEKGKLTDLGGYYTASTIDALDLITSQIKKFGNDPVKIQADLSTGSFKGFVGDIVFNGNNFFHFTKPGVYIVVDGKAVLQ